VRFSTNTKKEETILVILLSSFNFHRYTDVLTCIRTGAGSFLPRNHPLEPSHVSGALASEGVRLGIVEADHLSSGVAVDVLSESIHSQDRSASDIGWSFSDCGCSIDLNSELGLGLSADCGQNKRPGLVTGVRGTDRATSEAWKVGVDVPALIINRRQQDVGRYGAEGGERRDIHLHDTVVVEKLDLKPCADVVYVESIVLDLQKGFVIVIVSVSGES